MLIDYHLYIVSVHALHESTPDSHYITTDIHNATGNYFQYNWDLSRNVLYKRSQISLFHKDKTIH